MPFRPNDKKNKDIPKAKKVQQFSHLRGMKDILFEEYRYWDLIGKKAADLSDAYGFRRLDTPVLEKASLYERSTGQMTDVVSKEMYAFTDRSDEKVALRPEATPGIVRAYIEHGLFNHPQPVKTFWTGPLFRHEKPQSGRLRQHTQINFDIFGEEAPVADAQLMLVAANFFSELQIDIQIQINSIGCKECRENYIKKLLGFYKERGKRAKLCNDCKKRLVKNPLRLLDCKEPECQAIREDAPQIVDFLCDPCKDHFIKVLEYLDELEIPYNLNPYLVRGLDYYNRTVFEIVTAEEDEVQEGGQKRQSSLGGGGRYDSLMELMGGKPTPACGFGLGVERAIIKIKEKNIPLQSEEKDFIFLAQLGEPARRKMLILFEEMRRGGFRVRQAFTKDSLKGQLEAADRIGAKYCLILGQKELLDGTIILRDMESGTQEVIDCKKIQIEMNKRIKDENSSD